MSMTRNTPTDWSLPIEDHRNDAATLHHHGLKRHHVEKGWVRLGDLVDSEDWTNPFKGHLRKHVAPILVLSQNGQYFIKDGHHRADKAYRDGYTHIGAWIATATPMDKNLGESISKKQLTPVIQSFKAHAMGLRPENDLQNAMGPQSWELQVNQATQDFENHLSRITKRIIGRLEQGEYAPRSAMNNRNRPMDVDDKNKELSKVGSKATRDISKILGL